MPSRKSKTRLIITPGDPEGVGPEVTWKALKKIKSRAEILCVGSEKPFRGKRLSCEFESAPRGTPGFVSGWSIRHAVELIQKGKADALVTGPISKERLRKAGFPFDGHTGMLASLTRAKKPVMMLANSQLRVSLVTTHVPLKKIKLSRSRIIETILVTEEALRQRFRIQRPRIAVCGLNPHAGESGLLGNEEKKTITPAIRAAQRRAPRAKILGPFPADTIFLQRKDFDAVVCMYHDQGLIPVKLLDFPRTVNITLGLPILRTSVDHGTAFDIAGKNQADPSSMIAAIDLAIQMAGGTRR